MKRYIVLMGFIIGLCFTEALIAGGVSYYVPNNLRGLFYGQPTNARATGMGLTTITLGGIENSIYNPSSIGLEKRTLNIFYNYASGDPVYVGTKYSFLGISYRLNDRIVIGFSRFNEKDKNSPWSTIIGTFNDHVEKRTQTMYNLSGAYEIIPDLQVGISGNYLVGKAVPGFTTTSEFIVSLGSIYDMEVDWLKNERIQNQKIRIAGSFVNLFLKNRIEQRYKEHLNYRDLPIHLTLGSSYHFSMPFSHSKFSEGIKYIENSPEIVDFRINIQYRNVLKGPEKTVLNTNHKNNSSFGIGAEALFMDLFAFRMGYYFEKRPKGVEDGTNWVTTNKRGFTWGYGLLIPLQELLNQKVPFDAEVNFVTSRLLKELGTNYTHPVIFTKNKFLFSMGLKIKWDL